MNIICGSCKLPHAAKDLIALCPECVDIVVKANKSPQAASDKCSAELAGSVANVSHEMQHAGVKAAVRCGLIPEHAGEADYLRNWAGIKAVIRAALLAKH